MRRRHTPLQTGRPQHIPHALVQLLFMLAVPTRLRTTETPRTRPDTQATPCYGIDEHSNGEPPSVPFLLVSKAGGRCHWFSSRMKQNVGSLPHRHFVPHNQSADIPAASQPFERSIHGALQRFVTSIAVCAMPRVCHELCVLQVKLNITPQGFVQNLARRSQYAQTCAADLHVLPQLFCIARTHICN